MKRLIVSLILFITMSVSVQASSGGTLRVIQNYNQEPLLGGNVELYSIGTMNQQQAFDMIDGTTLTAQAIADSVESYTTQYAAKVSEPLAVKRFDSQHIAEFNQLTPGVYLVKQTQSPAGYQISQPILMIVEDNVQEIYLKPSPVPKDVPETITTQTTVPVHPDDEIPFTGQNWRSAFIFAIIGLISFIASFILRAPEKGA
ncbi:hypothetical protein IU403_03110 [Aerococcaceae bacterium zg-BR22]|uniref:hypothetical protein n=1 Tax=Aerococcaceae bacterium zg-1292 TaxID=2774330 RepID=UPI0040631B54|nr:hypothetical protein [Aerococcaceae bacterium zg-BR22]